MVVVRPRQDDDIGVKAADRADDLPADSESRLELAIVVVENLVLGEPEAPARLLRLRATALRKGTASLALMTGIAVGEREELDAMPHRGPLDCGAPGARVAVVGMGTDDEHIEGGLLRVVLPREQHENDCDTDGPHDPRLRHRPRAYQGWQQRAA